MGDFNGDGKADLVFANELSVKVLLGNGDGTFQAALIFPAGTSPLSVAVADFNGDGKMDLVVANASTDNNVSVLLGTGTGSFKPAINFAAGGGPSSVAVGDFDGDGRPDLAVANGNDSNISVLLNASNSADRYRTVGQQRARTALAPPSAPSARPTLTRKDPSRTRWSAAPAVPTTAGVRHRRQPTEHGGELRLRDEVIVLDPRPEHRLRRPFDRKGLHHQRHQRQRAADCRQ